MPEQPIASPGEEQAARLSRLADEDSCQLTTYDRESGVVHEVPMRYAVRGANLYLLSDEGGEAKWVKNIVINPEVSVRVGQETIAGMARVVVNDRQEEQLARELLAAKYEGWHAGQPLSQWASDALPVVIETRV